MTTLWVIHFPWYGHCCRLFYLYQGQKYPVVRPPPIICVSFHDECLILCVFLPLVDLKYYLSLSLWINKKILFSL